VTVKLQIIKRVVNNVNSIIIVVTYHVILKILMYYEFGYEKLMDVEDVISVSGS
jgi:hypothetical protein